MPVTALHETADGSVTFAFCDGCAPTGLANAIHLGQFEIRDEFSIRGRSLAPFCVHCTWCGTALVMPNECTHHGNDCPEDAPEYTFQALGVVKALDRVLCRLTDAGWVHLAEEVRICGRQGVPWLDAVVANLLTDPWLTEPTM